MRKKPASMAAKKRKTFNDTAAVKDAIDGNPQNEAPRRVVTNNDKAGKVKADRQHGVRLDPPI